MNLDWVKTITKQDAKKVLLWGVAVLTVVADAANQGIDIINYIIDRLGLVALQGGQDCSTVIGQIIGWFLGCV